MPAFLSGRELNRRFYEELVRPLLAECAPDVAYAAALLGPGSEVLGFDTPMSMDHDWGLRLLVFLTEADMPRAGSLARSLNTRLPAQFLGQQVRCTDHARGSGSDQFALPAGSPIQRSVRVMSLRQFVRAQLDLDHDQLLTVVDWLTIPAQTLRAITAGAVFHDGIGELTALRARLHWYPHDV